MKQVLHYICVLIFTLTLRLMFCFCLFVCFNSVYLILFHVLMFFFSPLHSSGVTAIASLVRSHWIKMHMDLERQNSTQIRWLKRGERKPPFNLRSAVCTVWMMWVIRLQRPMSIVRHGGAVLFCVWNLLVGELWCQHGVKQAINVLLHLPDFCQHANLA